MNQNVKKKVNNINWHSFAYALLHTVYWFLFLTNIPFIV